DDLKQVVEANIRERLREAQRAEALVEREVAKFLARRGDVEVIPTIVSLRERLEEIRVGEVRKALARLPGATAETRETIEMLSSAIVKKILHAPINKLRESSRAGSSRSWLELVPMRTEGDRLVDAHLAAVGGKGLFVREIEEALREGHIDGAVHSLKDLPAELPAGLTLGAFTEREDPRDVLVSRSGASFEDLR